MADSQRPEDEPHTLVFVDILGFEQFVRDNPTRVLDEGPDERGITSSGTTPLQSRVVRFQFVLDRMIHEQQMYGGVSAMIFSDCAYIDVGTSLRAAMIAAELMRDFAYEYVPVRMGIGRGTFYGFKYSMESHGDSRLVVKALFAGTAVVNAHAAEHCGEAGCRIFLHSSLEGDVDAIARTVKVLPVDPEAKDVRHELCYMPDNRVGFRLRRGDQRATDQDARILSNLRTMEVESRPRTPRASQQFTDTFKAVERMLTALGRKVPTAEEQAAYLEGWEEGTP